MSIHVSIAGSILALSLFLPEGAAQVFENINARFPMGSSEELYQDGDGFLWIGTISGLVRFDGYEAVTYTHDPADSTSIAGNNINAIGGDKSGRIWVGLSAYGLDLLDAGHRTFSHICIPGEDGNCTEVSVNDFSREHEGQIWAGTVDGLHVFSTADPPAYIRTYRHDPDDSLSLNSDYILYVFLDSRNRMWIGTADGLNLYDPDTDGFIHAKTHPTFPADQILDITEDRTGVIWVSRRFTPTRLTRYDESTGEFMDFPEFVGRELGDFRITFDIDNDMWISSRGVGAFHYDMQTGVRTYLDPSKPALHGFRNDFSLHTLVDKYENIWMVGAHVMKRPSTGKPFHRIDSDQNPVISIFANDRYVWYSESEPIRFDKETGEQKTFWPDQFPNDLRHWAGRAPARRRVYAFKALGKDRAIAASTRNVYIWDIASDGFREFPLDYGGPFREFELSRDTTHIWIAGNQGTPIHFDLATGRDVRPELAREIRNPRCLVITADDVVWFGSGSDGVYRLDPGSGEIDNFSPLSPDAEKRLSDYFVNDIAHTDEAIWVGTNLGLNRIDQESLTVSRVRRQGDFADENIMSILADDAGNLWLGTQIGLVRYTPSTGAFVGYDRSDGLINATYNPRSCYKDGNGWLYFGGDLGVDYFDPDEIGINSIPPDLYVSGILVNNAPADTLHAARNMQTLELRHTENFIEIELLALHLTAPEANTYAYRIPEIHDAWRDLGTRRTITLTDLRPGTYTLMARAANADGVSSPEKTLITVRIKPPFWATWWFIAIVTLVVATVLFLAYRYRIQQIETRERLKSEFNKRIAELESKALRAQMNPHFLFNSINSVKSLISQNENEKATQYLTRFGQLIRQVLANSEKPFVRLQEELEALRLYLDIEQLRFQNFNYEIHTGEDVNADFIEVPPLILQPYVENAIWHGLMHKTSGERNIRVEVLRIGDYLHMSVEDNGIGRERARQMKMLGSARKGGMGMRLTGDRLNLLNTLYGQQVNIEVTDLGENGSATGTRVEIRIPCSE